MRWSRGLRALSLRSKVLLTLAGAVALVVAVATYLSLDYWEAETVRTSEQQALLTAHSIDHSLEPALSTGSEGGLRRAILGFTREDPTLRIRVFRSDGTILYSSDPAEEGTTRSTVWLPEARVIPESGFARYDPETGDVHAFLPLTVSTADLLVVTFSSASIREGIRRGTLLALGLALGSILTIGAFLEAMLEREVVSPLHDIERSLAERAGRPAKEGDEVQDLKVSVQELMAREAAASAEARERKEMAEVGQLAAEMAHEFKRPLAAIRAALDMFDQEYRLDPGGRRVMTSVNEQLAHLTGTMQDLFTLAEPQELKGEPLEVRDVVEDALMEFAGQPGTDRIDVVRRYDPTPPVLGDARRLRQAMVNLMMNGLEAMPDGGTLTLAVESEAEDVVLSVTDSGVGMSEASLDKVFLPFHTTKPTGTGLGLPLVARVVSSHGGVIDVTSSPGEGTTVRIRLPAHATAPASVAP